MKIYLIIENNIITGYSYDYLPAVPELTIDDPNTLRLGFDEFIDNKVVKHEAEYQKSLQRIHSVERLAELKELLLNTDHKVVKYMEGLLTAEEYEEIKSQRQSWRNEINEIEAALSK